MRARCLVLLVAALTALSGLVPTTASAQEGQEVTIVRDAFGVPHVFGPTREAVSYGAGHALAQDRLWQMHVFRLIAKGRLSELLGPAVVDIDKTVRFFTYTQQERALRLDTYPEDIRANLEAFVAGINAWIDRANRDPSALPFEFPEFGVLPVPRWTVDDSIALQDVLILAFGSGGGNELAHAALLDRLIARLGEQEGLAAFNDLVRTDDPDDPVTIPPTLGWRRTPTGARVDEAESRRALTDDARLSLQSTAPGGSAPASPSSLVAGTSAQLALVPDPQEAVRESAFLRRGLASLHRMFRFGSNAQIVGPRLSEARNALQTAGPQVGYLVPQWLADFGIHGGGLDATGMTFAGAGPAVLIGRGPGYAWTTTTGASDLTDTYVEQLNPEDDRQYLFNGTYEEMECRTETFSFRGVPFDREEICRTRHGPVASFDEDDGVAYSLRYAWFNREGQTVEGFFRYNEVRSVEDFATFANYLSSNHNMFYADDAGHIGYWHPGNHPVRVRGVDLRLPQDGTGGSEWLGIRPIQDVPHAVDLRRAWLVNWNNQPSVGWHRERAWTARDNANDLELPYLGVDTEDPFGGVVNRDGLWDFEDLSANLRQAAFHDHELTWFRSALPGPEALSTDLAREALGVILEWDGFLVDRNHDGLYDSAGTTILDRWLGVLRTKVFADDLPGDDLRWARTSTELWHAVSPESTVALGHDWLGGRSREEVAAEAFEEAVAQLAEEFDSDDPSSWRREASIERYERLNADLFENIVAGEACGAFGCDPSEDSGFPGDIPEHIEMDRGTYNHVVVYLDPPQAGPLGLSRSKAGSVIPPGQNGFVSLAGREGDHYEDQLALYVDWRYKPMPLTLGEALALAESVTTITYPG